MISSASAEFVSEEVAVMSDPRVYPHPKPTGGSGSIISSLSGVWYCGREPWPKMSLDVSQA